MTIKRKRRKVIRKQELDYVPASLGFMIGFLFCLLLFGWLAGKIIDNNTARHSSFGQCKSDVDFVASVIAAEAAGEGYEGMYAVACVIQNRMKKLNKTAYEIVSQRKQFCGVSAINRKKLYLTVKMTADNLADQIGRLEDITNGATNFENIRAFGRPQWAKNQCASIGKHVFYKLY